MKKHLRHIIALILVAAMICPMAVTAFAALPPDPDSPQASYYISTVCATSTGGSGSVKVAFSITATKKMSSLGATYVYLYNSSGQVAYKSYLTTSGMMGYNKTFHSSSVTFSGLSAGKYYAEVHYKASNSSGYDTTSYTTGYATAT